MSNIRARTLFYMIVFYTLYVRSLINKVFITQKPSKFKINNRRYLTTNIYIVGKKNAGEKFIFEGCNEYAKRVILNLKFKLSYFLLLIDRFLIIHNIYASYYSFKLQQH